MDTTSIIVGILIGLFVNLITPSVQRGLFGFFVKTAIYTKTLNSKLAVFSIRRIEDEMKFIENLHSNNHQFFVYISSHLAGQVLFITLFVMLWFVASFVTIGASAGGLTHDTKTIFGVTAIYGGLGGIAWMGFRQIFQAAALLSVINKVSEFDAYASKAKERLVILRKFAEKANKPLEPTR